MAITRTLLDSGTSTADATSFSTASVSPGAGRLLLMAFQSDGVGTTAPVPVVTGCGLNWVKVDSTVAGSATRTPFLFRAMGTPTPGPITVTVASTATMGSYVWDVLEYDGVDTSGVDGAGAIVQSIQAAPTGTTAPTKAFTNPVTAGNETFAMVGCATQQAITPGAGWTQIDYESAATPAQGLLTQYAFPPQQTISASWATAANSFIVGVEIAAATTQTLTATVPVAATSSFSVGGSLSQTAGLIVAGASAKLIQNPTVTQFAPSLPVAAGSSFAVAGTRSQLGTVTLDGIGTFTVQAMPQAGLVVASSSSLAVTAAASTRSAVIAAVSASGLVIGGTRTQPAAIALQAVSAAAFGVLASRVGALSLAGVSTFVLLAPSVSTTRVVAMRATPTLLIGAVLLADYHPGRRVVLVVLDSGRRLGVLTPHGGRLALLSGRSTVVITRS